MPHASYASKGNNIDPYTCMQGHMVCPLYGGRPYLGGSVTRGPLYRQFLHVLL